MKKLIAISALAMAAGPAFAAIDANTKLTTKNYVDAGLATKADATALPTKVSDLNNDSGFLTEGTLSGASTTGQVLKSDGAGGLVWGTDNDSATDTAGKADKVGSAVEGNIAGLDAEGNLTDSGFAPDDFAPASLATDVAGKQNATDAGMAGKVLLGGASAGTFSSVGIADVYGTD